MVKNVPSTPLWSLQWSLNPKWREGTLTDKESGEGRREWERRGGCEMVRGRVNGEGKGKEGGEKKGSEKKSVSPASAPRSASGEHRT